MSQLREKQTVKFHSVDGLLLNVNTSAGFCSAEHTYSNITCLLFCFRVTSQTTDDKEMITRVKVQTATHILLTNWLSKYICTT